MRTRIRSLALLLILSLFSSCSAWLHSNLLHESSILPIIPAPVVPPPCDVSMTNNYGGGSGTVSEPYRICSLAQWKYFSTDTLSWNKSFKLYADIDFTGETIATYTPIGNGTTAFTGSFDGNSYKLKNLTLVGTTENLAVFKKTDSAVTIQNLILENMNFSADARMSGLILDHGNGGTLTLKNITVSGLTLTPTTGGMLGGLVGNCDAALVAEGITLNNLNFSNIVAPVNGWGGLAGSITGTSTISNLTGNNITLNGGQIGEVGGLVAYAGGRIEMTDITVTGLTIESRSEAGGLVFYAVNSASVLRAQVSGNITATSGIGGLVALIETSGGPALTMDQSSFTGTLTGDSGGLVYYIYLGTSTISKSFFKGTQAGVTGTAGGLIEYQESALTISDSYAISNLTGLAGSDVVGGLIGVDMKNLIINRSYYSGSVTGATDRACIADVSNSNSFSASNVYYNSTLCAATASTTGALTGVTGVNTAGLQAASPFPGWSSSVWTFSAGQNPKLAWEP